MRTWKRSVPNLRINVESVDKVSAATSCSISLPPTFLSSYFPWFLLALFQNTVWGKHAYLYSCEIRLEIFHCHPVNKKITDVREQHWQRLGHSKKDLKCYYDEIRVIHIWIILKRKQVVCIKRKMLFSIFKYLFVRRDSIFQNMQISHVLTSNLMKKDISANLYPRNWSKYLQT